MCLPDIVYSLNYLIMSAIFRMAAVMVLKIKYFEDVLIFWPVPLQWLFFSYLFSLEEEGLFLNEHKLSQSGSALCKVTCSMTISSQAMSLFADKGGMIENPPVALRSFLL